MQTFQYIRLNDLGAITARGRAQEVHADPLHAPEQFLGGGTTIVDLMKLYVMRPERLVDVKRVDGLECIQTEREGLRLGALVTMAQAARDPRIVSDYPMVAQALALAASTQIRNMARLGGNVLQRTRCNYFRDITFEQCNKRVPGSGCAALDGHTRKHAILGTSESCIASYPGDFAQALIALDATVSTSGPFDGRPFAELHRRPDDTPHIESNLEAGEMITGFLLPPPAPWTRRSAYLKIRDRDSYAFALASAAVGLSLDDGTVSEVRIGLGGVATLPWRAHRAEAALRGQVLSQQTAEAAAEAEFSDASVRRHNRYKRDLGPATLVRALLAVRAMEL